MIIKYGLNDDNIDVTSICYDKLRSDNLIVIPNSDHTRAKYFTDPYYGKLKSIFIISETDINNQIEFDHTKTIYIDTTLNKILSNDEKLLSIHNNLKIKYGLFEDELPEQKMSILYLTGDEKILEIGGNIGRNSLVIASILKTKNNTNFVVLESDTNISNQLKKNKNLNNFKFHIENAALSKRKLIQKGWDTIPSDILLDGYKNVNTITYNQIIKKYNIKFDTLVLDCEGAFYYILMDMPEILRNINLIIMENDYHDITHKEYIDNVLKSNNFSRSYAQSDGWGPCQQFFYEVWEKL
jgi:FkbM family methyltransferase